MWRTGGADDGHGVAVVAAAGGDGGVGLLECWYWNCCWSSG